jgi:hypothetical protein
MAKPIGRWARFVTILRETASYIAWRIHLT